MDHHNCLAGFDGRLSFQTIFDRSSPSPHPHSMRRQNNRAEHVCHPGYASESAATNCRNGDGHSSNSDIERAFLNVRTSIERLQFVQFEHRTTTVRMPVKKYKNSKDGDVAGPENDHQGCDLIGVLDHALNRSVW